MQDGRCPATAIKLDFRRGTRYVRVSGRRGTQVVRERSAKPLCVGSIPTRASRIPHKFERSISRQPRELFFRLRSTFRRRSLSTLLLDACFKSGTAAQKAATYPACSLTTLRSVLDLTCKVARIGNRLGLHRVLLSGQSYDRNDRPVAGSPSRVVEPPIDSNFV